MKFFIYLFLILFAQCLLAKDSCQVSPKSSHNLIADLSQKMTAGGQFATECVEQEFFDILLEPYYIQSLALKLCSEKPSCMEFLRNELNRVSNPSTVESENLNAVALWGEITKFSGFHRRRPPTIHELPLDQDIDWLFSKVKNEKLNARALNKDENKKFACSAVLAIMGPGKLKPLLALKSISTIKRSKDVEKLLSKNKLPPDIVKSFQRWEENIRTKGYDEVRKLPGLHDEPIHFKEGLRSARLNGVWRACYETIIENGVTKLFVTAITQDHKNYCKP